MKLLRLEAVLVPSVVSSITIPGLSEQEINTLQYASIGQFSPLLFLTSAQGCPDLRETALKIRSRG